MEEIGSDEDEEARIQQQIADLREEEMKESKKKRRKVMKEKRKLRDKMNLHMVHKGGDQMDIGEDMELFNLKKMKSKQVCMGSSRLRPGDAHSIGKLGQHCW